MNQTTENSDRLRRYMPCRTIGQGSFGKAILVKSLDDKQYYIAKTIKMSKLTVRDLDNCRKEVSILAALDHPAIVRYFESFKDDGVLYIIQEYANGGDLLELLNGRKGKPLTEARGLCIMLQITLALQYLHNKKIMHRDIKTENIFMCKDGMVKLGDFGLSRVLPHTHAEAKTVCGTPNYFAPELCMGQTYGTKADIWALGCVMYELLNLRRLFTSRAFQDLVDEIKRFKGPVKMRAEYSFEFASVVQKCLEKMPERRPSADQILTSPVFSRAWETYKQMIKIKSPEGPPITNQPYKRPVINTTAGNGTAPLRAPPAQNVSPAKQQHIGPTTMQPTGQTSPPVTKLSELSPIEHVPLARLLQLGLEVKDSILEDGEASAVEVVSVKEVSVAGKAQFKAGDQIVVWGKSRVKDCASLEKLVATAMASLYPVIVNVLRKSTSSKLVYHTLDIELKCREALYEHAHAAPPAEPPRHRPPAAIVEPCTSQDEDGEQRTAEAGRVIGQLLRREITRGTCERILGELDYELSEVDNPEEDFDGDAEVGFGDDDTPPVPSMTLGQQKLLYEQMDDVLDTGIAA